jgi:hypothetical protein
MKKEKLKWYQFDPVKLPDNTPDDSEDITWQDWKQFSFSDKLWVIKCSLALSSLLAIFNVGAILGWLQYYPVDKLWFPYSFLGIPAITVSGNLKWYNQIWVTWEAIMHILYANPVFGLMFFCMVYILFKKMIPGEKWGALYLITVFVELFTIFTTNWSI